jgi:hypothetical protein
LLITANSLSDEDSDKFEEPKKVSGFDLSGGWEYIPFGLRQVYEAASHINRILSERNRPEARPSEPTNLKPIQATLTVQKQESIKLQMANHTPNKQDHLKTQKIFAISAMDPKNQI